MITDVKSITTERDFEKFLRDAGYSRKEAAALTLHGFKALDVQRDAADDESGAEEMAAAAKREHEAKFLRNLTSLLEKFNV